MGYFAVIDTETNWENQVMSIGTVIADGNTFQPVAVKYHVLDPEYRIGGMFEDVLFPQERAVPTVCARLEAMQELLNWFDEYSVSSMFAYNAAFDHKLIPELARLTWYDIMRLAAYRQYNRKIPGCADCCSTGRLKRSYGWSQCCGCFPATAAIGRPTTPFSTPWTSWKSCACWDTGWEPISRCSPLLLSLFPQQVLHQIFDKLPAFAAAFAASGHLLHLGKGGRALFNRVRDFAVSDVPAMAGNLISFHDDHLVDHDNIFRAQAQA